jgi:hypothetical protein
MFLSLLHKKNVSVTLRLTLLFWFPSDPCTREEAEGRQICQEGEGQGEEEDARDGEHAGA